MEWIEAGQSSDESDGDVGQDVEDEAHRQQRNDLLEGRRMKGEADQPQAEQRACRQVEYPMGHGDGKGRDPAKQAGGQHQGDGGYLQYALHKAHSCPSNLHVVVSFLIGLLRLDSQ